MRGAFCLLCLRVFLCQSNINIQAGEFDNFPTTPPDGGQWVDAVLHADKGYYDLTGISDVIVGEEELQSFVKTKQYDYGLGNCLYITGTEQQNYPNPNVRRERYPAGDKIRIMDSFSYQWSEAINACSEPLQKGLNYIGLNTLGIKSGLYKLAFEIASDRYTYGYVRVLRKSDQPLKFAVFDIDDTAVLTRVHDVQNMVLNCQLASANEIVKRCAWHLYQRGYSIIYLSLRDFTLYAITRAQLQRCELPEGMLFLDLNRILDTWSHPNPARSPQSPDKSSHKAKVLKYLAKYGKVEVGFGDALDDMQAYESVNVPHQYLLNYAKKGGSLEASCNKLVYSQFTIAYRYVMPDDQQTVVNGGTSNIDLEKELEWDRLKSQLFKWAQPDEIEITADSFDTGGNKSDFKKKEPTLI